MKNFTIIFAVIVMAVLNFENSLVSAQTLNGGVKNHWELELEDGQHPKDPRFWLTGFIPQTRIESKKRNLSRQEFWDYIWRKEKPKGIIPSNPYWNAQWETYASEAWGQIVYSMKKVTRDYSASEVDLVKLFFKHADEVRVMDSVLSTGIQYWKKTGVVAGVGWTVKRAPYKTRDGGERMLVYEGEYGVVRFSLTCGNSFAFEAKTPPVKPPVEVEKVPVFCPEDSKVAEKVPVFCPDPLSGSHIIETTVTVPTGTVSPQPSQSGWIETTVIPGTGTQPAPVNNGGMVPATSAGPARKR